MSEIKPLAAQLQKVAIVELGEVPSRIPEDVKTLRAWIKKQPHLKSRTDDQFLVQFLRGCKYSLEKSKQKLDIFYAMKTKYPELFVITDVDNVTFRKFHNSGTYIPLPEPLNGAGPRIVFARTNYGAQEFTAGDIIQYVTAATEVALMEDPYACVYGMFYVMDMSQVTMSHILSVTPTNVQKFIKFFETAMPVRIKSVSVINLSAAAEQFYKIILPFISDKFRQRIFICGQNIEDLYTRLPKKYLPLEYGGENGSLEQLCANNNNTWDRYREFFKQNAQYGTDERLRVGTPLDFEGTLGVGGTFRKINVD